MAKETRSWPFQTSVSKTKGFSFGGTLRIPGGCFQGIQLRRWRREFRVLGSLYRCYSRTDRIIIESFESEKCVGC